MLAIVMLAQDDITNQLMIETEVKHDPELSLKTQVCSSGNGKFLLLTSLRQYMF